jgi:hypothetical protein
LRNICAGLVAAVLAFGLGASPASAANVLKPMLLTFNDLPGFWAPSQDPGLGTTMESVFQANGAKAVASTYMENNQDPAAGVDEVLGLWSTHLAAETAWHEWVLQEGDEQDSTGLNRVNPHHHFSVPVVMDESGSAGGPTIASWTVTAVKGRVFVYLFYAVGIRVNPIITIFERALNKVPVI